MFWQEYSLKKALQSGLPSESWQAVKNQPFLSSCTNFLVRREGLAALPTMTQPTSATKSSQATSWPFYQTIPIKAALVEMDDTAIYSLTPGYTYPLTVSGYTIYDAYDTSTPKGITTGGGMWHAADFEESYFLFNNENVVMKTGYSGNLLVANDIQITTGCAHRGRLVYGGFDPSAFWKQEWQDIFNAWKENTLTTFSDIAGLESNFVMWSNIGMDALLLFYTALYMTGHLSESPNSPGEDPYFLNMMRRGDMGFMALPVRGTVRALYPLGDDKVVAYCDDGVVLLTAYASPVPTYGARRLSCPGVYGRSAVVGSKHIHYFISPDQELWTITEEGVHRLGYRTQLETTNTTVYTMSLHPETFDLYISSYNSDAAYNVIYTPGQGMSRTNIPVCAIVSTEAGTAFRTYTASSSSRSVASLVLDFNSSGLKKVRDIEVLYSQTGTDAITLSLSWRMDSTASMSSRAMTLTSRGTADFNVDAKEFQVVVSSSNTTLSIQDIIIHYAAIDKRNKVSPYAFART